MSILNNIIRFPNGYSEGIYLDKTYGITKSTFNKNKSFKIYAEELGGTNFISLNFYITTNNELLKPCEMPAEKVIHFLQNVQLL